MEIFSSTTRFALACNQSEKVIEPIQSRCAVLRYAKLTDEQVLQRLVHVLGKEGVAHNDEGLEALVFTAEGDMRQALNNAQATHAGFGVISSENVFKVCAATRPGSARPHGAMGSSQPAGANDLRCARKHRCATSRTLCW